jgi:hypothetical protein
MMKSNGETVLVALMPPHPEVPRVSATNIASNENFQFNLTCTV